MLTTRSFFLRICLCKKENLPPSENADFVLVSSTIETISIQFVAVVLVSNTNETISIQFVAVVLVSSTNETFSTHFVAVVLLSSTI